MNVPQEIELLTTGSVKGKRRNCRDGNIKYNVAFSTVGRKS